MRGYTLRLECGSGGQSKIALPKDEKRSLGMCGGDCVINSGWGKSSQQTGMCGVNLVNVASLCIL